MSYSKAMKHARNVRKSRQQGRMYFGFDTGSGRWPGIRGTPLGRARDDVRNWFKDRHHPDPSRRQHIRECIREAVQEVRHLTANS